MSVPAVGRALLLNRPTVRQENKGKFGVGAKHLKFEVGAKHLTYNLLSSANDFWGFTTDRY